MNWARRLFGSKIVENSINLDRNERRAGKRSPRRDENGAYMGASSLPYDVIVHCVCSLKRPIFTPMLSRGNAISIALFAMSSAEGHTDHFGPTNASISNFYVRISETAFDGFGRF